MVIHGPASKYPKLYHMADKRNWDNICQHGLLSTTALLDLFEYEGQARFEIESQLRLKTFRITHATHGVAYIRDQDPMRDRPEDGICLDKCLVGITPQQWFEFLNKKVFFWTDPKGLNYMLGARLYRNRSHYLITVDTQYLLDRYAKKISLSSLNSGSLYGRKPRSLDTFKPLSQYPRMPWVTELVVDYSIPDILGLTVSVDECISHFVSGEKAYRILKHIWPT
jgi:hypothetical protein